MSASARAKLMGLAGAILLAVPAAVVYARYGPFPDRIYWLAVALMIGGAQIASMEVDVWLSRRST